MLGENIKISEDGIVEWASAIFHLASSVIAFYFLRKSNFKWLSVFWIIFSFFCFGEECSWLQRQIGYSVPQVEENNKQGEFNFHNLEIFESKKLMSRDGKFQFDYRIFLTSQFLFLLGLFAYFLIIPVLRNYFIILQKYFPHIPTHFLFSFWFLVLLSFVLGNGKSIPVRHSLAETRECLFAVFIFMHQKFLKISEKES